ncbi:MAG: hypothetical protein JWR20_217, partial [Marmoricola sp.]|nr:hypothetical protein [Marmoricola sp.]
MVAAGVCRPVPARNWGARLPCGGWGNGYTRGTCACTNHEGGNTMGIIGVIVIGAIIGL